VAAPELILFDDRRAQAWEPFALTRPAAELIFGGMRLVERAERAFGLNCTGYLTSAHLEDFSEANARDAVRVDALSAKRDRYFWCSRAAAEFGQETSRPTALTLFSISGQPAGLFVPAGQRPDPDFLSDLRVTTAPEAEIELRGRILDEIWDVLLETPEQLARDLADANTGSSALPAGVYKLGDHPLTLGRGVQIEPGAVFDTRDGPIRLEDEVEVRTGTRIAGPALLGRRSRLLGDSFEKIATGPYSYLHGEVSESVILGYVNKAHGGYLGHAYVGRWVNLGAFTTNSDLKNNYRPIRIWTPSGVRSTGRMKVGCFLGDHVKTGIGLLLGTGTVVGAGANVYGVAMPPGYVQPFSWGEGNDLGEYRLADFLETAETAMGRRGVELDERGRRHLERCWRKGRGG
jgi:UDP-N-acetylglucosamine diphosphorylase/glucosamine-1-phosphate N-acetyltransferase